MAVAENVEARVDRRNLKPLREASRAQSLNLFGRQWDWLAALSDETGLSQSELARRAIDNFQKSVKRRGV